MELQKINMEQCFWLNQPRYFILQQSKLILATEPFTNLWNQTYYHSSDHNAPILYYQPDQDGTVTVRCDFKYKQQGDQCGVAVYITEDCWFKVCVEYGDNKSSLLSSVVTMNGYSDWSSMNISSDIEGMYFRLHRREFDFKIENSFNGKHYKQMRIFHLDPLGQELKVGLYAASPLDSSFDVTFSEFTFDKCQWKIYQGEKR